VTRNTGRAGDMAQTDSCLLIFDPALDGLRFAANELKRFLKLANFIDIGFLPNEEKVHNHRERGNIFIEMSRDNALAEAGSFSIGTECNGQRLDIHLTGADDIGVLYAVYELLEHLGYGYYPDRDVIPATIDWGLLENLAMYSQPAIKQRGMFVIPWFDELPLYGIYWTYSQWEQLIDWMAKRKMNFLRLHIFPTMGFFPLRTYHGTRPAHRESDEKVAMMKRVIQRAQQRGIQVSLSFYPNAVTREFAEAYPGTSYNAWYTYFACLDSEVGRHYAVTTVSEMIEEYHPDYIELVTTEVHCPYCGWDKFSQDQIRLFRELIPLIVSSGTRVAIFPFVFPVGYHRLMELLDAPPDTLVFTESADIATTDRYQAGTHYIACFEENSTPFMRFKIEEVGRYARRLAAHGQALTYYLTGFSTKNFEITATAAATQFWNPYDFDTHVFLARAVDDRIAPVESREGQLLVQSLVKFEQAWQAIESITLSNGERVFGLMPSLGNSNYNMFLDTYASLLLEHESHFHEGLVLVLEAVHLLQSAKLTLPYSQDIEQLELNQNLLYLNYLGLLQAARAFVAYRQAQRNYKDDLWGKHKESEALAEDAHHWITKAVGSLRELVTWVEKDPDYHDVEPHYHPYQDRGASIYHTHSAFTLNVMKHRLTSLLALDDEILALRDKLIVERTFQGPHRPFVIPHIFEG